MHPDVFDDRSVSGPPFCRMVTTVKLFATSQVSKFILWVQNWVADMKPSYLYTMVLESSRHENGQIGSAPIG